MADEPIDEPDGKTAEEPEGYLFFAASWRDVAFKQKWFCAGCGQPVHPQHEETVFAASPAGKRYLPVLVHVHCRAGMLEAGGWDAWLARIKEDLAWYDPEQAATALLAAVPKHVPPPAAPKPAPKPPVPARGAAQPAPGAGQLGAVPQPARPAASKPPGA